MKKKLFFLYLGSFLVSVLPLVVFIAVRWNTYVRNVPAGAFRLTVGGVIACAILLLRIMGKLKIPSAFTTSLFLSAFCWAIQPLLNDLAVIFTLWAVGEALDMIFFRTAIRKTRKDKETTDTAQKLAEELKKAGGTTT